MFSREGRLVNLPAADQEPKHEEQLSEKGDKEESEMGIGIEVGLQAIDYPAQSIDYQENADDPGNVARTVDQVAQQNQMNSENDQAHGPIVAKRTEQKPELG